MGLRRLTRRLHPPALLEARRADPSAEVPRLYTPYALLSSAYRFGRGRNSGRLKTRNRLYFRTVLGKHPSRARSIMEYQRSSALHWRRRRCSREPTPTGFHDAEMTPCPTWWVAFGGGRWLRADDKEYSAPLSRFDAKVGSHGFTELRCCFLKRLCCGSWRNA